MTLINALETLKAKGITRFPNWNIDDCLANARDIMETAQRVIETGIGDVKGWQYTIDHAHDNFIVEYNGHYIIATHYDNFDMATYGDYDTDEEMYAAFDEWQTAKEAEEIADEMMNKRPGELPRAAWIIIATAELKAAKKAAHEAFEREFGAGA